VRHKRQVSDPTATDKRTRIPRHHQWDPSGSKYFLGVKNIHHTVK